MRAKTNANRSNITNAATRTTIVFEVALASPSTPTSATSTTTSAGPCSI